MARYRVVRKLIVFGAAVLLATPLALAARAAEDVNETRPVPAFDRVRLDGAFRVRITAGAAVARVAVSAESDVLRRVTTVVEGRTLVVGMQQGDALVNRTPRVTIALPELRGFTNDGAGSAQITGLTGADVDITNGGAAEITAAGRAARETISLNGAGKIDARAVDAHDVVVDNNGIGAIYVRAARSLVMSVNGVGEIRYAGTPSKIESHVNGVGRIGRL